MTYLINTGRVIAHIWKHMFKYSVLFIALKMIVDLYLAWSAGLLAVYLYASMPFICTALLFAVLLGRVRVQQMVAWLREHATAMWDRWQHGVIA